MLAAHIHGRAAEDLVHLPRRERHHDPPLTMPLRHELVLVVHELTRLHVTEPNLKTQLYITKCLHIYLLSHVQFK